MRQTPQQILQQALLALYIEPNEISDGELTSCSPIDGSSIGRLQVDTEHSVDDKIGLACRAFASWRSVPAPQRGELIRLFGAELRQHKEALGSLVTLECGKLLAEGLGEVQEMIDICDFAVGLSRQLYGLTMPSERPGHKMSEVWHPMGPVGVISAFNFPVAVWSWNAALALVCGNPVIWKPSEKTPLTALACTKLFQRAQQKYRADVAGSDSDSAAAGLMQIIIGDAGSGEQLVKDPRVPIISATGSTRMGRIVAPLVARRFGKCILELGGNNAMIVTRSADIDLALRAILFSAVGTCGQRCTSLRRLIVQQDIYSKLIGKLSKAYQQINIGNPLDEKVLVGPLIDADAFKSMASQLQKLRSSGAEVRGGERITVAACEQGFYVKPAIVEVSAQNAFVRTETFAPILYSMPYTGLDEAIAMHNDVPQGLSSCIFTQNLLEAETFLSARGSDCGIANVNIGPSGAEIGGAFGGEKETGGGRESGADAWKAYMRRSTQTVNYSTQLPLAQGIEFNVE